MRSTNDRREGKRNADKTDVEIQTCGPFSQSQHEAEPPSEPSVSCPSEPSVSCHLVRRVMAKVRARLRVRRVEGYP